MNPNEETGVLLGPNQDSNNNPTLENWQSVVLRGLQDSALPSFRRRLTNQSRQSSTNSEGTAPISSQQRIGMIGGHGNGEIEGTRESSEAGNSDTEGSERAPGTQQTGGASANAVRGNRSTSVELHMDEDLRRDADRLLRRVKHILPFVILLLIKQLYDHALGIFYYTMGTIIMYKVDRKFREEIALKERTRWWHMVANIVASLWISMFLCLPLFFLDRYFWRRLLFIRKSDWTEPDAQDADAAYPMTLMDVLWIVATNDLLARFLSIAVKSAAWLVPDRYYYPRPELHNADVESAASDQEIFYVQAVHTNKRKVLGLLEMASYFYRSALPMPVWGKYYMRGGSETHLFVIPYLFLKAFQISSILKSLCKGYVSYKKGELEYGVYASEEDLMEDGSNCSICFDGMVKAVKLPCNHMFCETCVGEWLEKESTCPICRAEVTRANAIPAAFRDGRTPWFPQIV